MNGTVSKALRRGRLTTKEIKTAKKEWSNTPRNKRSRKNI
mgnify:CR=1 FL=1